MKVSDLKMESEVDGTTTATFWLKLNSADEIDDAIAWLRLAKDVMQKWHKIRSKENAKASRSAQAAASENETSQRRQVQSESQTQEG
jgi:hypothetical protein